MKRIIFFILICVFLLISGCAPSVLNREPSDILVEADGNTLMTVSDFSYLVKAQEISERIRHAEHKSEKDLFLSSSESRILCYFSEIYAVAANREEIAKQYDAHVEEILTSPDLYHDETEYLEELRSNLNMSESELRTWQIEQSYIADSSENLLTSIADDYKTLVDPVEMEEAVLKNLEAMADVFDIQVHYPGLSVSKLGFSTIF